jgi:hypothetical protein
MTTPKNRLLLAPFSPVRLYRGSPGIWIDQNDFGTGFQDNLGATPQTAAAQTTGKRLDKSGTGIHLVQATDTKRPTLSAPPYADVFDGTDDTLSSAAFAAGTLTGNMDCFVSIKRTSAAKGILLSKSTSVTGYVGVYDPADAVSDAHDGTVTAGAYLVDGALLASGGIPKADILAGALTQGVWHILEVRNIDMSAWEAFHISAWAAYPCAANIGPMVLCSAQTDAVRAKIRRYLANKVGATV